jgi:hypothetical protein
MNFSGGNMRNKKTIIIIAIAAAAVLALILVMVNRGEKPEEPAPPAEPLLAPTESAIEPAPTQAAVYYLPYTGLPVEDTKNINRRPLSIKIENSPASWPQSGLNSADIVYETRVEGGMSRFNCIFQSNIPDEVGPVRSARLSDAWIVPQYDALFYYSGSNSEVKARLNSVDVTFGPSGDLLHRVGFKSAPHNLYMDVSGAYKAAKKKDISLNAELKGSYFGFDRTTDGAISGSAIVPIITEVAISPGAVSASAVSSSDADSSEGAVETSPAAVQPIEGFTGKPAESVSIDFFSEAKWTWDAVTGVWLRTTGSNQHVDGATEERLYTDNVVVMYAEYPRASKLDPAGSPTYDTNLGGEGKAMLFRDGYVYDCTWKADKNTPPSLFDESGARLPLKQGKTWFEVPPTSGMNVTVK